MLTFFCIIIFNRILIYLSYSDGHEKEEGAWGLFLHFDKEQVCGSGVVGEEDIHQRQLFNDSWLCTHW